MAVAGDSQRPHVGLNLVFLVPGETGGMEVYARELIRAIRELPEAPRLTAFVSRAAAGSWTDELDPVTVPVDPRRRSQWVRGEQQHLPGLAQRAGVDLVHSMASTAPWRGRFKRVTTVHDLIYLVHPEAHFGMLATGLRLVVGTSVRRSDRIIAVSRSTANDLESRLGVDPQKIDVVPNGVLRPPATPPGHIDLPPGRHVLLAASAKRPHKNLVRLLEAVASLEDRPLLVLPGYPTEHEDELRERARALGIEDDVRFLGWLDSPELEALYAASDGFIMPSLYEGFGLPVLEAMARGIPTACSDRSSLPEVAGDAALLFDPEDVRAMADAIRALLGPEAERLRAAGPARAAEFSWKRAAAQTVESYGRALEGPPGRRLPSSRGA